MAIMVQVHWWCAVLILLAVRVAAASSSSSPPAPVHLVLGFSTGHVGTSTLCSAETYDEETQMSSVTVEARTLPGCVRVQQRGCTLTLSARWIAFGSSGLGVFCA